MKQVITKPIAFASFLAIPFAVPVSAGELIRIGYGFNEGSNAFAGGDVIDYYGTLDGRFSGFWSPNPPYDEEYDNFFLPGYSSEGGDYSIFCPQGNRIHVDLPEVLGDTWTSFTLEWRLMMPDDDGTWLRAASVGEAAAVYRIGSEDRLGSGLSDPRIETPELERDQWYHVAFVYDHEEQTVTLYLDGEQYGPEPVRDNMPESPAELNIGASATGGGGWTGRIDDFRFTSSVLGPDEFLVEGFGTRLVEPPDVVEDILRIGYSFNEGSTTYAEGDAIDFYGTLNGRFSGTWSPNPPYDEEYDNFFVPGFSSEEGDYSIFCPQGNRINVDLPEVLGETWTSFTLEWHLMMPDDDLSWLRVVTIDDESAVLRLRGENRLASSLTEPRLDGVTLLEAGEWHHVALIYDHENQRVMMYLNGEPERAGPVGDNMPASPLDLNIGARPTGGGGWTGRIDNFRFTSTVLSPGEFLKEGFGSDLTPPIIARFADWREDYFTAEELDNEEVSGPLADPADDGLENAVKYAFGLDPREPARDALPVPEMVDGELRLTFPRRTDADDLTYRVQASDNLVEWASGPEGVETVSVAETEDGFEQVTVRPVGELDARAFLRILIELDSF